MDHDSSSPQTETTASILLVDDQAANLLALEAILGDLGANLVRADSGEEALRRLQEGEFAVVLLDVQMSGLDGFETARRMRSQSTTRHTPIIFLTAFDTDRVQLEQGYSLGAVDFLVKPVLPAILRTKVAEFVGLLEERQQARRQAEQLRLLADRELRESEARETAVLETALDCIITMDHEGKVVEFNPAAEKTFGYPREQVVGKELCDLIIPRNLREAHRKGMAHYLATGEGPVLNRRIEIMALNADGAEFPVELSITCISTAGPPLFTGYLRDISERTRIERHRNARLAITQVLAQAKAIPAAATGVLQAVCENLDWALGLFWTLNQESESLRCLESWHKSGVIVSEFEAASRARAFKIGTGLPGRVWATGKPAWILDVTHDANFPRAAVAARESLHGAFGCPIAVGGKTLAVIEFFNQQILEPDIDLLEMMDTVAGQFGQFMERVEAENQLRHSEQRFRQLADAMPQIVWTARANGDIDYRNRRWHELTGLPESAGDEAWGQIVHPDDAQLAAERWAASIQSGAPLEMEIRLLDQRRQGYRWHLIRSVAVCDGGGQVARWYGTGTDIHEQKQAEESLRDADRRKDEFLATLAHELRNPLAPIRNSLQILKMPRVEGETIEWSREIMERQVDHLVRLVDDLLDVSRVMRGKIDLRKEQIQLATIVARALETVQPLIEAQGHELTVRLSPESMLLDVDPVRLAQVVSNLLANAAKYTEPKGRIWLTAERQGEEAVLGIRDNGIGIAADMLPRIFELFMQADHATTRSQGGLGIGLTLAKNLVEMHGGTLAAHSEGLGQGSEFVVRLPILAQSLPADRSPQPEGNAHPPRPSGHRLLVVDDNQDAADSLATLLRLHGHDVQVAHSGPSALELANDYRPEIIFLDIGMPGMDGYEVARRLRQQPGMAHVVLAALTGWGQQEDRRRSAEAGFDHHLVKPPELKALMRLLADLKLQQR